MDQTQDPIPPSLDVGPTLVVDHGQKRVTAKAVMRRPLDVVFDFADNPANEPLWQTSTTQSQQTSGGGTDVGTTGRGKGRFLSREVEATWRVTAYEPKRRVTFTIAAGPSTLHGAWLFDPVPDGTRVRMSFAAPDGTRALSGRISDRVALEVLGRQLQGELGNLKRLLEA
ncbi:MAG: SRPBCC family protein [Actinobacteria bacterium]|nr:SRPBCC family protein [Actinomycetota bacterium]